MCHGGANTGNVVRPTVSQAFLFPNSSLCSPMQSVARAGLRRTGATGARFLATPSTSSSAKTSFSENLNSGPSFDDFISGKTPDRVVLGNTRGWITYLFFETTHLTITIAPDCHPISKHQYLRATLLTKLRRILEGWDYILFVRKQDVRILEIAGEVKKAQPKLRDEVLLPQLLWFVIQAPAHSI